VNALGDVTSGMRDIRGNCGRTKAVNGMEMVSQTPSLVSKLCVYAVVSQFASLRRMNLYRSPLPFTRSWMPSYMERSSAGW